MMGIFLSRVAGLQIKKVSIRFLELFESFQTNVTFIYPLKKSEKQRLFDDLGEYRKRTFESIALCLLETAVIPFF